MATNISYENNTEKSKVKPCNLCHRVSSIRRDQHTKLTPKSSSAFHFQRPEKLTKTPIQLYISNCAQLRALIIVAMALFSPSPREQVKPLAPSTRYSVRSHDLEDDVASLPIKRSQAKYVRCCGLAAAMFLILAVMAIVLGFTVFHVKGPKITMNGVTIEGLANGTLPTGSNITLLADVSIKNSNVASYKYENTTTWVYFNGTEVGKGRIPAGVAKARRTMRMNMTVDIVPAKIMAVPEFTKEVGEGALTMTSFTRVHGKVKVIMVKKNVVVELNCTMKYNFTSGGIQGDHCKRRVRL